MAAGVQAGPATGGDVASVAEGRWADSVRARPGRATKEPGRRARACPRPRYGVPLSTCVWAPAPAIAGALHRWAGGYGHATEAHRGVVTAVGAVAVDWPSQAAAEVFGGAS